MSLKKWPSRAPLQLNPPSPQIGEKHHVVKQPWQKLQAYYVGLCSIKFCEVASEHGGTLMMRGLVPVEGTTTKASLNEGEQIC